MPKSTFLNLPSNMQEKIITQAIKQFANKGYDKGNVGEIAKNSNVSKGSMYQYFENKEELYIFILKKSVELSTINIEKVCKDLNCTDIYDYIYEGFKATWPLLKRQRDIFVLLRMADFESNIEIKKELSDIVSKASETIFLRIIEDNKLRGFVRNDIDSKLILFYIDGISSKFKSYMLEIATNKDTDLVETDFLEYEQLIVDMINLMKNGILAKQ